MLCSRQEGSTACSKRRARGSLREIGTCLAETRPYKPDAYVCTNRRGNAVPRWLFWWKSEAPRYSLATAGYASARAICLKFCPISELHGSARLDLSRVPIEAPLPDPADRWS